MRINYNLSAMITNSQLFRNEKNQQSAAERLASGLKINHAKDDPAGMAISNKMDVQIEGIRQASRNSSDGISIIETADSSLNEVTNIIQRMRELAVQAASDTNCLEDREAIQAEIDSLSAEIDRVSTNTEFNKKVLLDGSLERRTYTNNRKVTVTSASEGVPTDKYGVTITADARQAVFRGSYYGDASFTIAGLEMPGEYGKTKYREQEIEATFTADGKLRAEAAGKLTINGHIIEFNGGESYEEIYAKLREGAEIVDVTCIATVAGVSEMTGYKYSDNGEGCSFLPDPSGKYEDTAGYMPSPEGWGGTSTLVFISKDYGSDEKINISCDNAFLATALGLANQTGMSTATGTVLAHSAGEKATGNSIAEVVCYRSTDSFLTEMTNPPVYLNRNDPAHEKYFNDLAVQSMKTPVLLYNGSIVDMAETDYSSIEYVDKTDPANIDYAGMNTPVRLKDGTVVEFDEINPDRFLVNKKYTTFHDKVDAITADLAGNIKIAVNYYEGGSMKTLSKVIPINEGDTAAEIFENIQLATKDFVNVSLTDDERSKSYSVLNEEYDYSQALVFTSKIEGAELSVAIDNTKLATMMGLPVCDWSASGHDCVAKFTDGDSKKDGTQRIGFSDTASITTKGNKITVTDKNGFELELEAEKKTCGTFYSDMTATGYIGKGYNLPSGEEVGDISTTIYSPKDADIIADVTGYGMMTVHTGANENQIIDVDIPKVDCKTLGIDGLNVRSGWTADKALAKLDAALTKVSAVRSKLGAYQNRLESTVASLDANDEDLTAAVSRIRDVDMAAETTEYTQHTILVQAATSVLAQANELPQQALQLIQ